MICHKPTKTYPEGRTGTRSGYRAHKYINEDPCEECVEGVRAFDRDRYSLSDKQARVAQAKDYNREYNLIRKYKITLEDYYNLLADQGGVCAICSTVESGGRGGFHVDHDHDCCPGVYTCGRCIRGLLCDGCNRGLGYFQDNPNRLESAARYVRRSYE